MQTKQIIKSASEYLANRKDIVFAYLFGSYASGRPATISDIDIAIFIDESKEEQINKLQLIHEFSEALNTDSLDLVILNKAPISLVYRIIENRIILIDRNPLKRHRFESLAMRKHFDFSFFEKGILERRYLHG